MAPPSSHGEPLNRPPIDNCRFFPKSYMPLMSSLSFLPLTLLDPPMHVTVGEHKEDLMYKLDFNDSSSSYVLLLTFNTCVRMP